LKQGFYNTLGGAVRAAITFLTIPGLIRIIGIKEFGLWALVSAVVGVIALLEGGLSVSTTVFVARDLARGDRVGVAQTLTANLGAMLGLATLAGAVLWFGAGLIQTFVPTLDASDVEQAAAALRISGLVVWARLLQQFLIGIEQACQRYGLMNSITTGHTALSNVGMLVVAYSGGHIVDLMKWQLLVATVMLTVHSMVGWFLLRHLELRPAWDSDKAKRIWRYGSLAWISSLGVALFSQCDRLIVAAFLGAGGVGVYAAVTSAARQVNYLSGLAAQPLLPLASAFSSGRDKGGEPERSRWVRQAIQMNAVVALGLGASLVLFSPEISAFLLQEAGTNQSAWALRVAAVVFALYSLNAPGYYVLLGLGASGFCAAVVVSSGAVTLLLIAIGAKTLGLVGAVVGSAGYLLTLLLTWRGMHHLGLPHRRWLAWVRFPLLWFLAALIADGLLPQSWSLRGIFFLAQSGVLFGWFLRVQGLSIRRVLERLRALGI
jgi:O-antigen/teichoic acid export membrane protein